MKDNILPRAITPRKQMQILSLAAFLISLLFPVHDLYADKLNECLMEALKYADDSDTVGQLREQCREEIGTGAMAKFSQESPAVEKGSAGSTDAMGNSADAPVDAKGPEEVILKTSRARKPAYFPHRKHQVRYSCGTCHHGKDSSGKLIKFEAETVVYKCLTCHNADMPNKELNDFQLIGHKLCRDCHRKNQDITSAKCSTCHRKNL